MIGEVIAWERKFIVISTGEEVYRTESNPYGDFYVEGQVTLDSPVEFDVINNRAVNVKAIFFAPNMSALRRDIHQIKVFKENENYCNEMENEGALHYQTIGKVLTKLTKNKNVQDVMIPIMKKLGMNMCQPENKPLRLTVTDGDKQVDVYEHYFEVGIIATLTRFNSFKDSQKAWEEYEDYIKELDSRYYEICNEHRAAIQIQKKLYFGSALKRKYNTFKYSSPKYDDFKI